MTTLEAYSVAATVILDLKCAHDYLELLATPGEERVARSTAMVDGGCLSICEDLICRVEVTEIAEVEGHTFFRGSAVADHGLYRELFSVDPEIELQDFHCSGWFHQDELMFLTEEEFKEEIRVSLRRESPSPKHQT